MSQEYQQIPRTIQLTDEEKAAYHSCLQSNALTRGPIPSAIAFGAFGHITSLMSPWRSQAKYVALGFGLMGYAIGKISLAALCFQDVLNNPNNTLKERIEKANRKRALDGSNIGISQFSTSPSDNMSEAQVQSSTLNIDDFPSVLDSDYHSTSEIDLTEPINLNTPVGGSSYEELRKRNREEYSRKYQRQQSALQEPAPSVYNVQSDTSATEFDSDAPRQRRQNRTKYGDVWD